MSSTTASFSPTAPDATAVAGHQPLESLRDGFSIAWRNLIGYKRVPQLVVFSTIQPVVFVLLFRYVFGGAIGPVHVPGAGIVPYVDFLMPGVFVQTVTFGALAAAVGISTDMKSGLLERFRSLPMGRSAVLSGRTFADLMRNVFVVILMGVVGFMVGFRVGAPAIPVIFGFLLVLAFGYCLGWVFVFVGLAVGDPETAQAAAFPILAPLVFASSVFVPVNSMPSWLQGWATYQPVSATATAVRALMLGGETAKWVNLSLFYIIVTIAIAVPLSVRKYRRTV
jgi:ABC-2 type transport system permease protein/oleandomycin transport system permease protein